MKLCETVPQLSLIKFHSKISGSFHENTKCHQPDELDFVFWTKSNIRDYEHIAIRIYNCIDSLIRSSHPSTHSPDSRLQLVCLCFGNKISSLLFKWKGTEFPDLDIKVDVAVCDERYIAKISRFNVDKFYGFPSHQCQKLN